MSQLEAEFGLPCAIDFRGKVDFWRRGLENQKPFQPGLAETEQAAPENAAALHALDKPDWREIWS
jgi:hypothetical protein